MAPKISLYIATSEDGFISDLDGGIDWLPQMDPECTENYKAFFSPVNALIMGRLTFEQILTLGPWPYGKKPCFVLSTTKSQSDYENIPDSVRVLSSVEEVVKAIQSFQKVWLVGGAKLAAKMKDYIDECIISIVPVKIEKGISLGVDLERYKLKETKKLDTSRITQYVYEKN